MVFGSVILDDDVWKLDKEKKKKKKNNRFDESACKYQVAMKREKENDEIGRKFLFEKNEFMII
jgi:hypothetical protein